MTLRGRSQLLRLATQSRWQIGAIRSAQTASSAAGNWRLIVVTPPRSPQPGRCAIHWRSATCRLTSSRQHSRSSSSASSEPHAVISENRRSAAAGISPEHSRPPCDCPRCFDEKAICDHGSSTAVNLVLIRPDLEPDASRNRQPARAELRSPGQPDLSRQATSGADTCKSACEIDSSGACQPGCPKEPSQPRQLPAVGLGCFEVRRYRISEVVELHYRRVV